ncbi:hypothetical protein FA95DRAFT_1494059, partial [Auriscalpium vulgare]
MDKPLREDGVAWPEGQDQERFVLYQALSLARGEVIRGRATRVWRAWRWDEMKLPEKDRSVFVIKDTWRDERRGVEGELYRKAELGVASYYSHGTVRINTHEDNTLFLIRKGVKPQGNPVLLELNQPKRAQTIAASSNVSEVDSAVFPVSGTSSVAFPWEQDHFEFEEGTFPPRNLVHSRLVVKSTGWPLLRFKSIAELLIGISDAIGGHQWLYNQGILHRDISHGNILLTDRPSPHSGILIDLDHAIAWKDYVHLTDDVRSGTLAFMSYEVITSNPYHISGDSTDLPLPISLDEGADPSSKPKPILHTSIHDLESFFWVLCFI